MNIRVAIRLCGLSAPHACSRPKWSHHLPLFLSHQTSTLRNARSQSEFHMFSHLPVRITRSRHCLRHLNFEVMERSELSCLLLSGHNIRCVSAVPLVVPCPASPCHACQTTTRSFSRCHHSPDDVIWLTPRASGELHLFNSEVILVQVDSDTVPHHLSERFPTRHKKITQDAARISKKS